MARKSYKFDECRDCARVNSKLCGDCDYGEHFVDHDELDTYERLTLNRGRFDDSAHEFDESRVERSNFDIDTWAESVTTDDDGDYEDE